MNKLKNKVFRVCPKSGRIVGVRKPQGLIARVFPADWRFGAGVVPAAGGAEAQPGGLSVPDASPCRWPPVSCCGWPAWLGRALAFRSARLHFRQSRWISGTLAVCIAAVGLGWGMMSLQKPAVAYTAHAANAPIGVAKGYKPGRVAWVHDPQVTDWNGSASNAAQSWFNHISQTEATNMMQWALTGYADATTPSAAWSAIFQNFNGGAAYQAGEKIFIKVNLTTSNSDACADANYNWNLPPLSGCGGVTWASIGNSPQLIRALLDQLVNVVGVAQSDITIGDSTGLVAK